MFIDTLSETLTDFKVDTLFPKSPVALDLAKFMKKMKNPENFNEIFRDLDYKILDNIEEGLTKLSSDIDVVRMYIRNHRKEKRKREKTKKNRH